MQLYNTLSKKKEKFKPLKKKEVGMYVCGPTIYDYGHLGHGRSAVNFDVIRRYLKFKGYKVNFIFNYTDIDDKIIERANKDNISISDLTKKFTKIYNEDYNELNVLKPTKNPKPTKHIKEIIEIIKDLEKNGFTYQLEGGLYFDTSKFKGYGKLSHQDIEQLQAGKRIKKDENKKNYRDFVIWKLAKKGEPAWKSPWGEGRPGWHIECSAMSKTYLGKTFDIHGGGQDLIFPHHENEIAQSEAANKKPFANYWLHNGFIQVNKEKMSKSLGNFFTLKDAFKEYDPMVVRYMIISAHYRAPIDFSKQNLEQAKNSLNRIQEFVSSAKKSKNKLDEKLIQKTKKEFIDAMDNDFDTPKALATIFQFVREANKLENGKNAYDLIIEFDKTLGLNLNKIKKEVTPEEIKKLLLKRETARTEKDWKEADRLRDEIKKIGYLIEDSKEGLQIKRIK
ncbi:cysteine--tRNA ligase [archaeon]|jgi:cysteinyl-tRNA synthetase|nr:cysteine--tRNA ligase [archaeon]MBT6824178.1 cysteine--tRNA ligase [archaeon]MBT7106978.1 cysteine--tRNA ligase [archaeon]MBT7297590.1 cysteine--tRNA ligase [archaeon]